MRGKDSPRAGANPFDDPVLAAGYEAWYETEGRVADEAERCLLGYWLAGWPQARTVLDIGTGTGHFARWLASAGYRVVGIDSSAAMLAEAARRGGVWLVRADAGALPFISSAFDVAMLVTTLEFLPRPVPALQEAARVTRLGIVLGVLNRWHPLAWKRKRSGQTLWQAAHFYSPFELKRLVRRALGARASRIEWRTTLLVGVSPCRPCRLPLGAFIGMRVTLRQQEV